MPVTHLPFTFGQQIIWNAQAKWAGKWQRPATYLGARGAFSCRIKLTNGEERTVRVSSVQPTNTEPAAKETPSHDR